MHTLFLSSGIISTMFSKKYTTVTETYDVMLSVKKGLKDRIKDKFYGFKVGQYYFRKSLIRHFKKWHPYKNILKSSIFIRDFSIKNLRKTILQVLCTHIRSK
jgi:hypothetical protein